MKGSNVVEMIQPAPERLNISREQWAKTPEVIRDEIWRMVREITAGIEKYRPASERHAELAEFHALAAKGGTTVHEALSKYVAAENQIRANPVEGITQLLVHVGVDPIKWARGVLEKEVA